MEKEIIDCAKQVHIKIEEQEVVRYAKELGNLIKELEVINEVDTNGITKDISIIDESNSFREDVVKKFDRELLMQNAPEQENGMFRMPKILN